jgi:hypothetical protein
MRRDLKPCRIAAAALFFIAVMGTDVCRAGTFLANAFVVLQGSTAAQDMHQDSVPVSAHASAGPGTASSFAIGGAIGASSSISTPVGEPTTNNANAGSEFTITDVIFSNTKGETSFTGTANLLLTGSYSVQFTTMDGVVFTSISTMQLSGTVISSTVQGVYIAEYDSGGNFQLSTSGVLSGLAGGGPSANVSLAMSVPISGQANTPLTIDLSMEVNTVASVGTSGSTNFGDPLSFATTGPVFDLPDGWTANSVSGNIVDNHFVGLAAVPEPSGLFLLAIGALPVISLARRVQKRPDRRPDQG